MRPHGSLQVVSTCWQLVCVWVTGLQHERRFSTNRLLWLSGSVTGQQDSHPGRGEPIGAPHEQSAPSRDSALAKILPLSFPKILSCYKICCVCAFHVSEKRRWWWLQHCLRCVCVCVFMIGDRMSGCVFIPAFSCLLPLHRVLATLNNSKSEITVMP